MELCSMRTAGGGFGRTSTKDETPSAVQGYETKHGSKQMVSRGRDEAMISVEKMSTWEE